MNFDSETGRVFKTTILKMYTKNVHSILSVSLKEMSSILTIVNSYLVVSSGI